MPFARDGSAEHAGSLRDLTLMPFWLDDPRRPAVAAAAAAVAADGSAAAVRGRTTAWAIVLETISSPPTIVSGPGRSPSSSSVQIGLIAGSTSTRAADSNAGTCRMPQFRNTYAIPTWKMPR